jgi:hypothetical protein
VYQNLSFHVYMKLSMQLPLVNLAWCKQTYEFASLPIDRACHCKRRFTHSMPCPCRSPAMPCRKGFRICLSHFIYTVRPCLIHTCHAMPMPCSDHAVLLKATAQHGRRETASRLPARVRLLPGTTRSSTKVVVRSIPILITTIHTYDCKEW